MIHLCVLSCFQIDPCILDLSRGFLPETCGSALLTSPSSFSSPSYLKSLGRSSLSTRSPEAMVSRHSVFHSPRPNTCSPAHCLLSAQLQRVVGACRYRCACDVAASCTNCSAAYCLFSAVLSSVPDRGFMDWRLRCHMAKRMRPAMRRMPAAAAPIAAPAVAPVLRERVARRWRVEDMFVMWVGG